MRNASSCPSLLHSRPATGGPLPLCTRGQRTAAHGPAGAAAGNGRRRVAVWGLALAYAAALLALPALYRSSGSVRVLTGGPEHANRYLDQPSGAGRRAALLERPQRRAGGLQPCDKPAAGDLGLARVEYRDPGRVVSLLDALNVSAWDEPPLYHPSAPAAHAVQPAPRRRLPAWCPQADIRVFVGITSRCCTPEARAKRAAQRATWVQLARDRHPELHIRFVVAQPAGAEAAGVEHAAALLREEVAEYADVVVVPGLDAYRQLPSKTLRLLRYAVDSPCRFTHVLKTDDDVHLRPAQLLRALRRSEHAFSLPIAAPPGTVEFDGVAPAALHAPWLRGTYLGAMDCNQSGAFPGWVPNRDATNKWYLSEADLSDEDAAPLLGTRFLSGWGYLLSADLAQAVAGQAALYAADPARRPGWWGRLPWEDVMVAALLRQAAPGARAFHHDGFLPAWRGCGPAAVLKHLDSDAPALQEGLHAQELSGLWSVKEVVCSSGLFETGNHTAWRAWRNSLPDSRANGYM